LLIFLGGTLYSQNLKEVDSLIQVMKYDKSLSLDELTIKITKPFKNNTDKTRAIFDWIADNIEYDYKDYEDNTITNKQVQPDVVFQKRKGVCEGYSNLFRYMLDYCDIENEVIRGYGRNNLKTIFVNKPNHAWNSVKLNGKWYLFDVTWARDTLKKKVDYFYFKTNPNIFILSHYPLDYKWSLLDKHYSLDEFMKFPIYTNLYYDIDFADNISKKGYLKAINNRVTIKVKPGSKFSLLTKLYDLERNKWISIHRGKFTRRGDSFKLYIPRKGKFILQVGVLKLNENSVTIYDPILYYVVENK
jgi:hypothetical protein